MRSRLLLLALAACGFSKGWVGQQMVNRPDKDTCDQYPAIAFEATGRPWIVWTKSWCESTLVYSRWDGDRWTPQHGVGANAPGVDSKLRVSLCFDASGRAWLTWTNLNLDNSLDVASSFCTDSGWSPEAQANTPSANSINSASKIACGGGQVWCVWDGAPTDMSPYSVFASRWNSLAGAWEPEMQVSPPDSTFHWWCDVAVDAAGIPHVVWCNSDRRLICYSYYDGAGWRGPTAVNDTVAVGATGWAAPRIVVDHAGVMHVCYTGVAQGATGRDIFYSRNDGAGWTASVRVTGDTEYNYNEWYSDIAAETRDNVWVAWERQGEGSDQFRIYAAHFDGRLWSAEQRLDNDSAYYDVCAAVALDTAGLPWVAWHAITYSAGNDDIYFNYYLTPGGLEQTASCPPASREPSLRALMTGTGRARLYYTMPTAGLARIDIYDRLGRRVAVIAESRPAAGQYSTEWNGRTLDGKSAPTGTYICRLQAVGMNATCSFVLLSH
jgi:hypothetical protein